MRSDRCGAYRAARDDRYLMAQQILHLAECNAEFEREFSPGGEGGKDQWPLSQSSSLLSSVALHQAECRSICFQIKLGRCSDTPGGL